jgi:hypothetical protein
MAKPRYESGIKKPGSVKEEMLGLEEELQKKKPELEIKAAEKQKLVDQVKEKNENMAEVSDMLISKCFMKFYEDFMYLEISSACFFIIKIRLHWFRIWFSGWQF